MTDAAALVKAEHGTLGSWTAVAAALGWSPSLWWQIAHQGRKPTREQTNALRRRAGLPEIPKPPAEVVRDADVAYTIETHDGGHDPDTAILAYTGGNQIGRIDLIVADAGSDGGPALEGAFTPCKMRQVKRRPKTTPVYTLSAILAEPTHPEGRGRSGNREAIETAARRASQQVAVRGNLSECERREMTALLGGEE